MKALRNLHPLSFLFPSHAQADMRVLIMFVCLHVQVYAAESVCGVFVSRSERPAPVINGVPVWGTARRRTQSLGQTAAPPGLSFTWGEEKGGKEGGWRGKYSLAVLYSLFPPLCPSILLSPLKTIYFYNYSLLSLFRWPLSSVQLKLWHVHVYVPSLARARRHNVKKTNFRKHTGKSKKKKKQKCSERKR